MLVRTRTIRRFRCWSTLLLLTCTWPAIAAESTPVVAPKAAATLTADAVQEAFVRAAERIKPSIVTIYAERVGTNAQSKDETPLTPPDGDGRRAGLGTGMVVDASGAILTNYHVVKGANSVHVVFNADDERPVRLLARIVGFDEESDLAVLQLANPAAVTLKPVEFADSDAVRVGEWAIAVGAPFDQAQTITVGIVSAKSRQLEKNDRPSLQEYLQTDASINPGNSGGPLLNLDGKVIGINTAILSPSQFNVGIGFALPSNIVREYWPILRAGKSIKRGFLGIRYVALDTKVAQELGIEGGMQIGALAKNGDAFLGPAYAAGLREGDIITHVDEQNVITTQDFRRTVANRPPGAALKLKVLRPQSEQNQAQPITVILGDWPSTTEAPTAIQATPEKSFSRSGLLLKDAEHLTRSEREALQFTTQTRGAIITEVLPGSAADSAQINRGLKIERIRLNNTWHDIDSKTEFLRLEGPLPTQSKILIIVSDKNNTKLYKLITIP